MDHLARLRAAAARRGIPLERDWSPSTPAPEPISPRPPAPETPAAPPAGADFIIRGGPLALDALLDLPLDRFAALGRSMLEVRVPGLSDPAESDVAGLLAAGISRGRIWTAGELLDLLAVPGMTREAALTVARAKLAFAGEIVEIRQGRKPTHPPERPGTAGDV